MITVVDYGMGNLRNVRRAFEHLLQDVHVTNDPESIRRATRLILPGVGAFGEAVRRIEALGLREALVRHVESGKPLLGICLGMQLLFDRSEESPGTRGLGLLPGEVVRFGAGMKVPHIGWNDVRPTRVSALFGKGEPGGCFYFVHSYFVPESRAAAAMTVHGMAFVSAVEDRNVMGLQFHPEKSQMTGLELLKKFVNLTEVSKQNDEKTAPGGAEARG